MLPSQTDTKNSIAVITILLKICPVYLTLSLWNFSDSILVKEIMVRETKTINRYWRAPFPEWFPTGNHRTGKPVVNSQAQGSSRNAHNACFQKGIRLLLREFLSFQNPQTGEQKKKTQIHWLRFLREKLTHSQNTSTHQPSPAGPLLACSSLY